MNEVVGVLFSIAMVTVFAGSVNAEPVQWKKADGGNGHWYEAVDHFANWADADTYAKSQEWNGMAGYLATITSAAENAFITDNVEHVRGRWIGGYRDGPRWGYWITAERWNYTNWYPGEPNNHGGSEYYLQFSPETDNGTWNDNRLGGHQSGLYHGIVIEYGTRRGGCGDQMAGSTLGTNPTYGLSGLFRHLSYFFLPCAALTGFIGWRRRR